MILWNLSLPKTITPTGTEFWSVEISVTCFSNACDSLHIAGTSLTTAKNSNFKHFHQETLKYILKYFKFYEHVVLNILFETEYINLVNINKISRIGLGFQINCKHWYLIYITVLKWQIVKNLHETRITRELSLLRPLFPWILAQQQMKNTE